MSSASKLVAIGGANAAVLGGLGWSQGLAASMVAGVVVAVLGGTALGIGAVQLVETRGWTMDALLDE